MRVSALRRCLWLAMMAVGSGLWLRADASGYYNMVPFAQWRPFSPVWVGAQNGATSIDLWGQGGSPDGSGDGQLDNPWDATNDGTYLYVTDLLNYRVTRFVMASGLFTGWIGKIGTSPTGGAAGCSGATVGTFTPGWCMGGTGSSGTGNGMINEPSGVNNDGTYLYVSDSVNGRINRYTMATGAFQGWIGDVLSSPTGGAAGCNGAPTGAFTPGWCTGGTAQAGAGDGMTDSPAGITNDGTYLYLADVVNDRINRYVMATGVFQGWIGNINASPTGGASGCSGASVGTFTPGWCTGGTAKSGNGYGMMNTPRYVSRAGTYLYVSDSSNSRIDRYTTATGAFQGWVGGVGTSPTGGAAGCNGAPTGAVTPGWCLGGTSAIGTGDGMMYQAFGVNNDGSYIYATDFDNFRINRYALSTGVSQGWIGAVSTSPTGGSSGCTGLAAGSITPGWCTGGTSESSTAMGGMSSAFSMSNDGTYLYVADRSAGRMDRYALSSGAAEGYLTPSTTTVVHTPWTAGGVETSGTADGELYGPSGVTSDETYLYVSDSGNDRIARFLMSTGAWQGWIGGIATSPTGGATGCSGAAAATFTPGWCTGGRANTGLTNPQGVSNDGTYLYVAQLMNNQISRYTMATGAFQGWIGNISSSPTGGASGCSGAAAGTFTPGWCMGGAATNGTGDGMMYGPYGVSNDGTYLYVADGSNFRIQRFTMATGAFQGWIGNIKTSPTGGASGCSGAAVSTFTPGWCTGGTGKTGTGDGMLNTPSDVNNDGTYLYVADGNNRVSRYTMATGAFQGWLGKIKTSPTGGASGCNGAAVGIFTPGWCTGGTAKTGTGNGMMNDPENVYNDNFYLYVSDNGNGRINRYTMSTGAFQGWIGDINTSPTGGGTGCNGAAVGTFTPNWCQGGTSVAGSGDGMMSNPAGIVTHGNYFYVSDSSNNRVIRFNLKH